MRFESSPVDGDVFCCPGVAHLWRRLCGHLGRHQSRRVPEHQLDGPGGRVVRVFRMPPDWLSSCSISYQGRGPETSVIVDYLFLLSVLPVSAPCTRKLCSWMRDSGHPGPQARLGFRPYCGPADIRTKAQPTHQSRATSGSC